MWESGLEVAIGRIPNPGSAVPGSSNYAVTIRTESRRGSHVSFNGCKWNIVRCVPDDKTFI
jgi:hypothetical protein